MSQSSDSPPPLSPDLQRPAGWFSSSPSGLACGPRLAVSSGPRRNEPRMPSGRSSPRPAAPQRRRRESPPRRRPGAGRRRRLAQHRRPDPAQGPARQDRRPRFLDALLHQLHPHPARPGQAGKEVSPTSWSSSASTRAKFDNEKDTESIRKAILRYEITHPVVNDANMTHLERLRRQFVADACA